MEHMNRTIKAALRNIGANFTPKAIDRVGKSIGAVKDICSQFENSPSADRHRQPCWKKDLDEIMTCLKTVQPFSKIPGRKHRCFDFSSGLLGNLNIKNLKAWLEDQLNTYRTTDLAYCLCND